METIYSYYLSEYKKHNKRAAFAGYLTLIFSFIYILFALGSFLLTVVIVLNSDFFIKEIQKSPRNFFLLALCIFIILLPALAPIIVLTSAGRKIFKAYKMSTDLTSLEELPPKYVSLISKRIADISPKIPVIHQRAFLDCSINYFLERNNYGSAPSMTAYSKTINLILPLGFLKLIKSNPTVSDAILAHELAHYFHKDFRLLLIARAFFRSGYLITIFSGINIPLILFFYPLAGIIVNLIIWFFADRITKFFRRTIEGSEELADLFASVVIAPQAVKEFLGDFRSSGYQHDFQFHFLDESKTSFWTWMSSGSDYDNNDSLHPALETRISLLEYYENHFKQPSNSNTETGLSEN